MLWEKIGENKYRMVWKKSLCIVLCSNGYPESYKKNIEIPNFFNLKQDNKNFIYHAGTEIINNKIFATGGRVLNFVSTSDEFINSKNQIIEQIQKLNWKDGFYRSDIGHKVIKRWELLEVI